MLDTLHCLVHTYTGTWILYFVDLHLGVILVNNQLDALFSMCLFHLSTCFEQPSAHHQENQLYHYIIWYISLCVGDCLVCRSGVPSWPAYQTVIYQSDIYQMMYWYNWFSWWWALGCSKHVESWNKYTENSASSWLLTTITGTWVTWCGLSVVSVECQVFLTLLPARGDFFSPYWQFLIL